MGRSVCPQYWYWLIGNFNIFIFRCIYIVHTVYIWMHLMCYYRNFDISGVWAVVPPVMQFYWWVSFFKLPTRPGYYSSQTSCYDFPLFILDQVFGGFNADMYDGTYDVTFLITRNELTVNDDVTHLTVFTWLFAYMCMFHIGFIFACVSACM